MTIRTLNGLVLPSRAEFKREIVSRPELRSGNYNDEYDFHTLVYDVFYSVDRGALCLICPPLLNLKSIFRGAEWRAGSKRLQIASMHSHKRFVEVWMAADAGSRSLNFSFGDVEAEIPILRSEPWLFANMRSAMVKSRNNDLRWIRDWTDYHVKVHGLEGVVLFDHGSDLYAIEEVEETILSVAGVRRALVIPSPYRFGPTTDNDALFLQVAELNIARLRFLARAAGVLICDLDELVCPSPDGSVFETTRKSLLGYSLFHGSWRYPEARDPGARRLHLHHTLKRPGEGDCQTKYCVRPRGPVGRVHWDIHASLRGSLKPMLVTSKLHYWHCYGVSTGWKVDRSRVDPQDLAIDQEAAQIMRDIFSTRQPRAPQPSTAARVRLSAKSIERRPV
jgi:hypothetical protein